MVILSQHLLMQRRGRSALRAFLQKREVQAGGLLTGSKGGEGCKKLKKKKDTSPEKEELKHREIIRIQPGKPSANQKKKEDH